MPFYIFSTLHAWNSRLIPLFGFPLNALLFRLVWTKTPKEMRVHSRILLQTCIVDLAFLSVSLIATPALIYRPSFAVFIFDGYLTQAFASIFNYDPAKLIILNHLSLLFYFFDIFSINVQFVYRYLLLNRDLHISLCRYFWMLTLPCFASLCVVIPYAMNFIEIKHVNVELKASLYGYIDRQNAIYFVGPNNSDLNLAINFTFTLISYSINIFCGVKVVKFVGANAGFNPRMKELNQQLTKTLIILALMPMLTFLIMLILLPLFVVLKLAGIKSELVVQATAVMQYFFYLILNWLPLANPMVSIWINRPYRDAVKKGICGIFKSNSTIAPVQPLNAAG